MRNYLLLLLPIVLPGLFVYAVLVIGVIEEAVKMIPFLLVVLGFREFLATKWLNSCVSLICGSGKSPGGTLRGLFVSSTSAFK